MAINRETTKYLALIIKWHMTGRIEKEIEFEKAKLEDTADAGAINYEESGGGKGGVPGSSVEMELGKKQRAVYNIKVLEHIRTMVDIYLDLLGNQPRKILELYYKEDISLRNIATRLNCTKGTIKNKKSAAINLLAQRLDLDIEEEEKKVQKIGERIKKADKI